MGVETIQSNFNDVCVGLDIGVQPAERGGSPPRDQATWSVYRPQRPHIRHH